MKNFQKKFGVISWKIFFFFEKFSKKWGGLIWELGVFENHSRSQKFGERSEWVLHVPKGSVRGTDPPPQVGGGYR